MAGQAPLTTNELDQIRSMHAEGETLSAIAAALGRGKTSISKHAARMGLEWGITRTAGAVAAKVASNRDKRATLEARLLDEAGLLLDQLHQPHTVFSFGGRENTYEEYTHSEPDVNAKATLIRASTTAMAQALKLADADKATSGAEAGASMVGSLFVALAMQRPPEDAAQPSESDTSA